MEKWERGDFALMQEKAGSHLVPSHQLARASARATTGATRLSRLCHCPGPPSPICRI